MASFNTLTYIIDALFFVDILVQFRTTYMNNMTGDEIWAPNMIARRYGFSVRLWIDVLSTTPFEAFTMVSKLELNITIAEKSV